jgi:hypothetical protein
MPGSARRIPILICLLLSSGVVPILGAGLLENGDFIAARQALNEGLPGVAAVKATRLLEQANWDSMERSTLAAVGVEAWLRAKEGRPALEILAREDIPNEAFLEGQARVLTGELGIAETLLSGRLQAADVTDAERLLLAQVYLAQGKAAQTREALRPLLDSTNRGIVRRAQLISLELEIAAGSYASVVQQEPRQQADAFTPQEHVLRARALVELGRHQEAQDLLRGILIGSGGSEHVHHAAAVLLADSMFREGRTAESVEALVQFLDNTLDSVLWSDAFDLLAKTLTSESQLAPPSATLRWITEGNTAQHSLQTETLTPTSFADAFRGHAMLLVARWLMAQQRNLEALGLLEAMIQVQPAHPQGNEAMRLALEMYGALKIDDRANMLADQWRRRFGASSSAMVNSVTGTTAFARGDYRRSAALFQSAAELATTLSERRGALFNAGVAALKAGEQALYIAVLTKLAIVSEGAADTRPQSQDGAADLELAKALDDAAQNRPMADEGLRAFVKKFPEHPRLAEAYVALAEWMLLQPKPDFAAAETALQAASGLTMITTEQRQRVGYVRVWLLDKSGNLKGVTEAGSQFLSEWPDSPLAAEMRMKVADAFFRQGNFASARTEFELVVKDYANSPFADTALYFAGLSALSILSDEGRETAISLWQELGERGGPLSVPARQQQAMAKRRMGEETEALKLLDVLLTEKTLSQELRRSLTCEKAEILIVLGKTDPLHLGEAAQVLTALRADKDLPYFWRARVGYTLAAALNEAGKQPEAMEACYDVVQSPGSAGPSNPAEYRWYYKAGFFGIDLLAAAKQWESAARLAEKLALSKGDRATEAKERATTIRLEHFLWDGETK